jgi:hypothetical protein
MALTIKAQIKDGASGRRERAESSTHDGSTFYVTSLRDYERELNQANNSVLARGLRFKQTSHPLTPDPSPSTRSVLGLAHDNESNSDGSLAAFPNRGLAWEMDFVMKYLDYVFPFLFPFYRPPLVGTSRAWLLSFLRQNDAVFHSMLSLSSFFFTVALRDIFPSERHSCKSVIWGQVAKQADISFEITQKDLMEINSSGAQASLLQKARIMETIVQLLTFELFIGKLASWDVHLSPALALFEDIFEKPSRVASTKTGLSCVLEDLGWPPSSYPGLQRPLWNPDQAAFRFFTAILLFYDIVASTSLQRAPRLRSHHSRLLADLAPEEIAESLDLSAFIGCQNWVLQAVGDIAALDEWKQEMKETGCLVQAELVERGDIISRILERGIISLDAGPTVDFHKPSIGFLQPYSPTGFQNMRKGLSLEPTRIWAHAAQIYVDIVVSGWLPSAPRVRQNVARVITLLQAAQSAAQMRTFAWPLCVAGCLAEGDEQEQEFDRIIAGAGDLQLLSAVQEAGRIMKAVWSRRRSLDYQTWDISACFGALGTPALLV